MLTEEKDETPREERKLPSHMPFCGCPNCMPLDRSPKVPSSADM